MRIVIALGIFLCSTLFAQEKNGSGGGFLDFNLYPYTQVKSDTGLTLNIFSQLPQRFQYFSLNNYANQSNRSSASEFTGFFSEQNLRWALPKKLPFDLTLQWNIVSNTDNDKLRLGTRLRLHQVLAVEDFFKKIKTQYSINIHAIQFDHEVGTNWQIEHVYRVQFTERFYLSGFGDHNQGGRNHNTWVTEHQFGFKLYKDWYAISEFRRNELRKGDENSIGVGMQYIISH
jgi:hypothetical protein